MRYFTFCRAATTLACIVFAACLPTKLLAAAPANDNFAARDTVSGTNWNYVGNAGFATREPDEPQTNWLNTVWMSWLAPYSGRIYLAGVAPQTHAFAVYTGATLAGLQQVPVAGVVQQLYTMLIQEGVEYHFQFTGNSDDFSLALNQQYPFVHATNDNFASAQRFQGEGGCCADSKSFLDATMEPGEPLHRGDVPQKSLWYVWQAPRYGILTAGSENNFFSNGIVFAVYQGQSVDALNLWGKGTNSVRIQVLGGETYYIAAAVPAEFVGDLIPLINLSQASSAVHPVPGNLLGNPSFEGGETNGRNWSTSGGLGGNLSIPASGGVDGMFWPYLPTHEKMWQEIPTIPGHLYRIRFAYRIDTVQCCGIGGVSVLWDEQPIGTSYCGAGESFWHWSDYYATASNATTLVTWTNLHINLDLDVFSVIDMNAPPEITREPVSLTTLERGTAVFVVDSLGTRPLHYEWRFNGTPIPSGPNRPVLTLSGVTPQMAGNYSVVITNSYGTDTSIVATLTIDSPTNATILVQPYGDTVPAGGYYNFMVVAAGLPTLSYQWLFNGAAIPDATNRNLTFTNITLADAGRYEVRVQNDFSTVLSLPAFLAVTNPIGGGARVFFTNRRFGSQTVAAPIYDEDGTPLAGSNYVAQLYAGMALEGLRAVAAPVAFSTNESLAGFFTGAPVTIPNIPPGVTALAQLRVWERAFGSSYEEARARGGKFGKSKVLEVFLPQFGISGLTGLLSFNLQAGLPRFLVGKIEFVERQAGGTIVWALHGEPGFAYVVEKSRQPHDRIWQPHVVLTNQTGTITFTDSADSGSAMVLYRSRILD